MISISPPYEERIMSDTENTRGGRRTGAGRKPGPTATHAQRYLEAKADKERGLADLRTMEAGQRAGALYDRGEVLTVISTAIATFADQMRALPDRLERSTGLSVDQAERAEAEIDTALEALKESLGSHLRAQPGDLAAALRTLLADVEGNA
jgi:hypothetical protein